MFLEIATVSTRRNSTLSAFYINGVWQCWVLEDGERNPKVPGDTRIPPGLYPMGLRTEGGMHQRYQNKFSEIHKGMLHIQGIPNFEWVYIHIGNTVNDTLGCPLVGTTPIDEPDWRIGQSTVAYKKIYPQIAPAILSGEKVLIQVSRNK